MPESHKIEISNTNNEFTSLVETCSPETEHADQYAADTHSNGVGENRNTKQELVIEEEEAK